MTKTCEDVNDGFGRRWLCQTLATYGEAGGDSGAPVFVWQGNTVQLAGIHVGSKGSKSVFSDMGNIQEDFNPTQIHTFYSVFVNGAGGVWSPGWYSWEATPTPSSGSHTYQWQAQYVQTGQTVTLGTAKTQSVYFDASTGHVLLKVTSTFAQTGQAVSHERLISNNIGGGPEIRAAPDSGRVSGEKNQ